MAAVGAETRRASRSNTDLTSVIDLTSPHLVSQLLPGPRRPHPSGLRTDPEDLGRLLVGQAHPVQEHQSLSLTACMSASARRMASRSSTDRNASGSSPRHVLRAA